MTFGRGWWLAPHTSVSYDAEVFPTLVAGCPALAGQSFKDGTPPMPDSRALSRRQLLTSALSASAGAYLGLRSRRSHAVSPIEDGQRLVWSWQFSIDGSPEEIGRRLLDTGVGIVLKTHDGVQWMSTYDDSQYAISGPSQLKALVGYYESAGIPCHAWAALKGLEPAQEAEMCAEVIAAGARSLFLDLGAASGYWKGTPAAAELFGNEVRRRQPEARIILTLDGRPWLLSKAPLAQFLALSDAIAVQAYWHSLYQPPDHRAFADSGFPVPAEGLTPEFLVGINSKLLGIFGLPILYVGEADAPAEEFRRFRDAAQAEGSKSLCVWRAGTLTDDVLALLAQTPQATAPAPARRVHVVAAGDTLSGIALAYGVSVNALAAANGLADANRLTVGQELVIP